MPLRRTVFAPNEHYHLCVRGNNKQIIFRSHVDRARFLFLVLYLQSEESFKNVSRLVRNYMESGTWNVDAAIQSHIVASRYVSLEAFAFMDNHVHLVVREAQEQGTTRYMQRILTAYAKYINTKYETVGHIFQGPFRAVHISDNEQLLYLSTYVHRNPRELAGMAGKEHLYAWSSYKDYLGPNRFGALLDPSLVLEQFDSVQGYKEFVDTSIAKDEDYLFDPF